MSIAAARDETELRLLDSCSYVPIPGGETVGMGADSTEVDLESMRSRRTALDWGLSASWRARRGTGLRDEVEGGEGLNVLEEDEEMESRLRLPYSPIADDGRLGAWDRSSYRRR